MSQFVDECQLNVRGGDGGAGCVSFRREGPVSMGGPNGGDGGRGGDVWLVADHNVASLLAFRDHPHRRAGNGVHGKGKDQHGRTGDDEMITVPEGTIVKDLYTGEVLAELLRQGDRWLAAAGGRGGRGNAKFLSNRRRAPSFAEQGEHGEERWLKLELNLLADVALVGFPNVGKSTLISVISAAKPKIANYPFTTLEPNLGVVRVDDDTDFIVADIPGLIEGASEGRGLGHQFLRHVQRARVLALLIDLTEGDGVSAADQERILLEELERFRPELVERPRVVLGTKADAVPAEVGAAWLTANEPSADRGADAASDDAGGVAAAADEASGHTDVPRLVISAITGDGVRRAVGAMAERVHGARQAEPQGEGMVLLRPATTGSVIERLDDGSFRVHGRDAERVVALNDVTSADALNYISHRLERLGVNKLLARAGAADGDVVWIGEFSFEYRP